MKKVIVLIIISFITISVNAQLANTKWKGTLNIEGGMETLFNFSSDTLIVLNASSNETIETMKYVVKDSVVTLQKLYGNSECDGTTIGTYKFEIKNDAMTLSLVSDGCNDRSGAIGTMKLTSNKLAHGM
ncbi:MAG TPA: hypothetical protein VGP55_04600 [Chitinophagaceae bacterium]|nr:hypothetical protein [Chitinophagaceae bacterium]